VQRFFKELESAGMITRINTDLGHQEGHFTVRNYETYNPARATDRAGSRAIYRTNIKEGLKEVEGETSTRRTSRGDPIYRQRQ
jgi:hypothetical protein